MILKDTNDPKHSLRKLPFALYSHNCEILYEADILIYL